MSRGGLHPYHQHLHQLDQFTHKENDYLLGIEKNQSLAKAAAKRLYLEGGEIESTLRMLVESQAVEQDGTIQTINDENETQNSTSQTSLSTEEIAHFLQEQRERLKTIAMGNAKQEQSVSRFVNAVRQLRAQVDQQGRNELQHQGNNDAQPPSVRPTEEIQYETRLLELVDHEKNAESTQEDILSTSKYYREILQELGESGLESADNDDDDDIAVVRAGNTTTTNQFEAGGGSSAANNLKCPVTGQLLEDPVKNTVCDHVYSRQNIMNLIRQLRSSNPHRTKYKCPVAGCHNKQLNASQLQPCLETAALVRREKHRLDALAQQRASQAANLVDTDEE
jgi:hypothetical protein